MHVWILIWAVSLLSLPQRTEQSKQQPFEAQVTLHVSFNHNHNQPNSFDLVASTAPGVDPPPHATSAQTAQRLKLFTPPEAASTYGCSSLASTQGAIPSEPFALLLKRGKCTFAEKAKVASGIGAGAVIIYNEEKQLYNSTTGYLHNPCLLDCSKGESMGSPVGCEASPSCGSNYCLSNPVYPKHEDARYCCVDEKLIVMHMGKNASKLGVVAVYINYASGRDLLKAFHEAGEDPALQPFVQIYPPVELRFSSLLVMWVGGTLIVCAATFVSQRRERAEIPFTFCGKQIQGGEGEFGMLGEEDLETLELNPTVVTTFFVFSCGFLLFLFFLVSYFPRHVIMVFIVLFGVGSVAATSTILVRPLLQLFCIKGICAEHVTVRGTQISTLNALSVSTSVGIVIVWFAYRHSLWTWILQDTLAFAVACAFLSTTRIAKLRHGVLLLGAFFCYDIFMTFITPVFFGGKSVMVEVATAGKGSEHVSKDRHTCERTLTEKMPMLFLFPDGSGGLSVLGLGDVFLPGIFIAYCLRVDYLAMKVAQQKKVQALSFIQFCCGHKYYVATCCAYAAGFMATILANLFEVTVNGVQGQPALLYLVPAVLGAFSLVAHASGELELLWKHSLAEIEAARLGSFVSGDESETQVLVNASDA